MRCILLVLVLVLLPLRALAVTTHGVPEAASESQAWWGDTAQGYVVQGCLPAVPTAGTTLSVPACRAYALETPPPRRLRYFAEPGARSLTLPTTDGTTWLFGRAEAGTTPVGLTCQPGTHYCWLASPLRPGTVDGAVLLAQVKVVSGAITEVGDMRPDSPMQGPINLLAPLYGAVGDCVADDTAALQATLNAAAWQERSVSWPRAPGPCYAFTRLWLLYDATANPRFPQSGVKQGNYSVIGTGQATTAATITGPVSNTYLKSTDPTGPALNGNAAGQAGNPFRNLVLSNFSVEAGNTTRVVDLRGLNSMARLDNLYIVQTNNAGGGMLLEDIFLARLDDLFVFHSSNSSPTGASGAGLIIRNSLNSGGIIELDNVTARGWGAPGGTCLILGHTDLTVARIINNIDGRGVQAIGCDLNIRIAGGAVAGSLSTMHSEGAKSTGLWFTHGARNWTLASPYFQNPAASIADVRIGNALAPASEEASSGLTFISPWFNSINQIGILRETTANTVRTVVINPAFVANVSGQGIGMQCALLADQVLHGVTIFGAGAAGPPVDVAQAYKHCEQASIIEDPNYVRFGAGVAFGATETVQLRHLRHGEATLDFPSIAGGTCGERTIPVAGMAASAFVLGTVPDNAVLAGLQYTLRASGTTAGEVLVRACNVSGTAQDPPAAPFQALTWEIETVLPGTFVSIPATPDLPTSGSPDGGDLLLLALAALTWVGQWARWLASVVGSWVLAYLLLEYRPLRRLLFGAARALYGRTLEE